jgi:hypothetical protein
MTDLARNFTEFTAATSTAIAGQLAGLNGYQNSGFRSHQDTGFKSEFWDRGPGGSINQVRHSVGGLIAGFVNIVGDGLKGDLLMNTWRERNSTPASRSADVGLNNLTMPMGASLAGPEGYRHAQVLHHWIRETLCASKQR